MTTHSQRALILYRRRRFINHLLTYLLTFWHTHRPPRHSHWHTRISYHLAATITVGKSWESKWARCVTHQPVCVVLQCSLIAWLNWVVSGYMIQRHRSLSQHLRGCDVACVTQKSRNCNIDKRERVRKRHLHTDQCHSEARRSHSLTIVSYPHVNRVNAESNSMSKAPAPCL